LRLVYWLGQSGERGGEMTIGAEDVVQVTVRSACMGDAGRIAVLCGQLGYPASVGEVQGRLEQIEQDQQHAVYVAALPNGHVVGWVHVHLRLLVVANRQAEVGRLVVDEQCHRCGVGRLLMQHAGRWARENGCRAVCVRSNVIRQGAHVFYEQVGYSTVKTQLAFRKTL
jgi:GNAT superfamily N-acetyltransferase